MSKSAESWSLTAGWPLRPKQLLDAHAFGFRFAVRSGCSIGLIATRGQIDRLRKEQKEIEVLYILPDGTTRPCARGKRT